MCYILTLTSFHPGISEMSNVFLISFLLRMKEERSKKRTEDVSEVLSWVNRSRKLQEKKNVVKERALQLSKKFEEQVNLSSSNLFLLCIFIEMTGLILNL